MTVGNLQHAIENQDEFEVLDDDTPVMLIVDGNSSYELMADENRRLTLGDLREILRQFSASEPMEGFIE